MRWNYSAQGAFLVEMRSFRKVKGGQGSFENVSADDSIKRCDQKRQEEWCSSDIYYVNNQERKERKNSLRAILVSPPRRRRGC